MTHREASESAAAYALGALDEEDRTAFEQHLDGCAECRAEVDTFRDVVGTLGVAAPPAQPADGAALRDRILGDARALRPISSAASAGRSRPGRAPWLIAAAAAVVAMIGGYAYLTGQREVDRLRNALAATRAEAAAADSVVAAFLGPEVHVVSLATGDEKPAARVFWNHTGDQFIVTAHALRPAPAGRTYQLWAIADGKAPVSMGTFDAAESGRTIAILPVDPAIVEAGFIDYCGLTVEPEGGSPQPTEEPRLIGTWRHVD